MGRHDHVLNRRLGKVDEVGHSGHLFVLQVEIDNGLERNQDFARSVKVSVRLGFHDAVNVWTIAIWNDFAEKGNDEKGTVLFVVKM